ncbi:hypothetical protein SAMN02910317_01278 [Ruminococcaceae bacterium FB2012]|nr:hypothetical protein SAMN02910317_01278 [Ruminococcaceae bacterium FB2012]
MERHFVDIYTYIKADENARNRIFTYRVPLADLLYDIKTELFSQKERKVMPAPRAGFTVGYTLPPMIHTHDSLDTLKELILPLRNAGIIRRTLPNSAESDAAFRVLKCSDPQEFGEYCNKKSPVSVVKLIEVFNGIKSFNKLDYEEQLRNASIFINDFKDMGIDIVRIISVIGEYKPTARQLYNEYVKLKEDDLDKYPVSEADISYVRKRIKDGESYAEIRKYYYNKVQPKDRSLIARYGITAEQVRELMKKHDQYTPDVAEELREITGDPGIDYQQVDRFCNRYGIPLGRYYDGAVFCDMEIISRTKEPPNSKYLCRCTNCGEEKEFFQSALYKYSKDGTLLCRTCKAGKKQK